MRKMISEMCWWSLGVKIGTPPSCPDPLPAAPYRFAPYTCIHMYTRRGSVVGLEFGTGAMVGRCVKSGEQLDGETYTCKRPTRVITPNPD